jgi:hypothetical protein
VRPHHGGIATLHSPPSVALVPRFGPPRQTVAVTAGLLTGVAERDLDVHEDRGSIAGGLPVGGRGAGRCAADLELSEGHLRMRGCVSIASGEEVSSHLGDRAPLRRHDGSIGEHLAVTATVFEREHPLRKRHGRVRGTLAGGEGCLAGSAHRSPRPAPRTRRRPPPILPTTPTAIACAAGAARASPHPVVVEYLALDHRVLMIGGGGRLPIDVHCWNTRRLVAPHQCHLDDGTARVGCITTVFG